MSLLLVAATAVAQDISPVAPGKFLWKNGPASVAPGADEATAPVAPAEPVELSSQHEPVKNSFADCHAPCGGPGLCPTFCGQGNACCRKSGDVTVPDECKGVYNFWTTHYECIAPVRPAFDAVELGAGPEEAAVGQPEDTNMMTYGFFGAGACFVAGILGLFYMAGEGKKHDDAELMRSMSSATESKEQQSAAFFDRRAVTAAPAYLPMEPTAGFLSAPGGTFSQAPTLLQSGHVSVKKPGA